MSNAINLSKFPSLQSALAEAGNTGLSLYVPPGRHLVRGENHAEGNIRIHGDTSAASVLAFEDGASLVYRGQGARGDMPDTEDSGHYHTTELMLERIGVCVTGNSNRVIDAQWSNTGNSGTLAPTLTARDLGIYAMPGGRWEHAIHLAGASNVNIEKSWILGSRNGFGCGPGVYVDGSVEAVAEFFATRLRTYYCSVGCYFAGHVEGMNLNDVTTIQCDYGVIADCTSNPGAWPMLHLSGSHLNTNNAGVITTGIVQIDINHNWIYNLATPGGTGIVINSSDVAPCPLNSRITDNTFVNLGDTNTTGVLVNHTSNGAESLDIEGNTFESWKTALYLNSGTTGVRVGTNRYPNCKNKVIDNGVENTK